MTLETDLSRNPYFNDFSPDANYYAVLYRPGVPVQTRELNAAQSILQDQIAKFGRNIFVEGSVVEGCAFSFDNHLQYVKILDNYSNGTSFTIADFQDKYVTNSNGLKAVVVDVLTGFESQAPDLNTLYLKYLNSGTYPNGQYQSTFDNSEQLAIVTTANVAVGNVAVANVANAHGEGYSMSVSEGTIFKKGYFIRVPAQNAVVVKYSNKPDNLSVGFGVIEEIVTPEANTELYDNAAGGPNFSAPGAHRLKLDPVLITRTTTDVADTSTFFSLCDFRNGKPVTIKNTPQYAALGTELAKRTFETNGDFVVKPFFLNVSRKADGDVGANTDLSLIVSPGLGYAKGYRVEFLNNDSVNLRKGLDTANVANQVISANFGYYIKAKEFVGDFNTENFAQVELHSAAKTAISSRTLLGTSYVAGTKIGTAYVRGIELNTGTPGTSDAEYLVYLFNIEMLPGFNFSQAKSVIRYAGSLQAVADITLTYDYSTNANVAKIEEIASPEMVYSFGQKAIAPASFSDTSFIYRNRANSSFAANGSMSVTVAAATGTGTEGFTYSGTLADEAKGTFIAIPAVNGYSANLSGTVQVFSTNTAVIGTGTAFTTEYSAGDYFSQSGVLRRIASIANSTLMNVDAAYVSNATGQNHQEMYPAGVPIPFVNRSRRSISIAGTTATFNLGASTNAVFNMSVYHDILRADTVPVKKVVKRNTLIKIDTANNAGGTSGPWSLGLPDVIKVNHIWASTNGTYSNTGVEMLSTMRLDNGQRDAHYDLAKISSLSTGLTSNTILLVSVDHFTYDQTQGVGFFTANSYPIDDANTANTSAIRTAEIPLFTSPTTGRVFDLRDSVDFRPFGANTAAVTNVVASATVNPVATLSIVVPASGSYLPAPNRTFETDLAHYMPRRDRVSMTTSGQVLITEGVSGPNPKLPETPAGTMALGTVDVTPYPTLSPAEAKYYNRYDYAVKIDLAQTQRYTMADIKTLADRISNIEYYTSLSLLEQAAINLQVRSSTTGQNRFKNGILVDPFRGHDVGNTLDAQYAIAIDPNRQEARPLFRQWSLPLNLVAGTGYRQRGDIITIDHEDAFFQSQPRASKYRNCIEGNVYQWRGQITLTPGGDMFPDTTVAPDVVANQEIASNFTNMPPVAGWGASWGNWSSTAQHTSAQQSPSQPGQTTTTVDLDVTSGGQLNLGEYVTNVSITPYIRTRTVFFNAFGLKPNTRVYAFFNDTPVSDVCRQMSNYYEAVYTSNGKFYKANGDPLLKLYSSFDNSSIYFAYNGDWGTPLVSDAAGRVFGQFTIPDGKFRIGDITFKLSDVPDLAVGEDAIKTQAQGLYYASGLSVSTGQTILNTRPLQAQVEEILNEIDVIQSAPAPTVEVPVPYPVEVIVQVPGPTVYVDVPGPTVYVETIPDGWVPYVAPQWLPYDNGGF